MQSRKKRFRNVVLAFLSMGCAGVAMMLAGCGGGGGGGGGSPTSATTPSTPTSVLAAQDVLNLYPTFYLSQSAAALSFDNVRSFFLPFLDPTSQLPSCQTGSAVSDYNANAVPSPGAVVHVSYTNCATTTSIVVAGQTQSFTQQLNGQVTYTLNSFSGDFLGAKSNLNANLTVAASNFSISSSATLGNAAPVRSSQTVSGSYTWTLTAYNWSTQVGQEEISGPLDVTFSTGGMSYRTTVTSADSKWSDATSQRTRTATAVTLSLGQGQFSGQAITLTGLVPSVYPLSSPTALGSNNSGNQFSIYSQPSSGTDVLTYGASRVYVTYTSQGVVLQIDANGDNCIDSTATVSSAQLNSALNSGTGLPAALLTPTTGACVPAPGTSSPPSGGGGGGGAGGGGTGSGGVSSAVLALLAGQAGGFGNLDATGASARFANPLSAAVDGAGNVYVADSGNNEIRKITPLGVVTTLAGMAGITGHADGAGATASFNGPSGVTIDSSGNLYVADTYNNSLRKITPLGVVTTLAGAAGTSGFTDSTGAAARFSWPAGVATDSAGNVYVADTYNFAIRKITPMGVVTTLAGSPLGLRGYADGTGAAASFNYPTGVAVGSTGNVYVADSGNNEIRKITPAGVVTTLAGFAPAPAGYADGTGSAASFYGPAGVATDNASNVYVADTWNGTIRKITPMGVVTTLAGTAGAIGHADGTGAAASFNFPQGVAADSGGNVYVADSSNGTIRKITPAGLVTTLAGAARATGSIDGTGAAARFMGTGGLATDSAGNVYLADSGNNTIRKITAAGVVTTLAGTAGVRGHVDGTGASASFNNPSAVATDAAGNAYVADTWNNTVRKITPAGVVTTLAGTAGLPGFSDGTGAAARFGNPTSVATDSAGNVYVSDNLYSNPIIGAPLLIGSTVRKITPAGVVTTLAGAAGTIGHADGTGAAASFKGLYGVATDNAGNVYVADMGNSIVRRITPAGVVTTLAGTALTVGHADGTGAAASFNNPIAVATDSAGNVYVADEMNDTIRKITSAGVVSTVVGQAGVAGFVAGSSPGVLNAPCGVAVFGNTLYIAVGGENLIASVTPLP